MVLVHYEILERRKEAGKASCNKMKRKWRMIGSGMAFALVLTLMSACGAPKVSDSDVASSVQASAVVQDDEELTDLAEIPTITLADGMIEAVNMSPYSGKSAELGDDRSLDGVYAFQFTNVCDQVIEQATVSLSNGEQEFMFELEMLIPGETVFVTTDVEYAGSEAPLFCEESSCTYLPVEQSVDAKLMISGKDGMLTVKNITDEFLPILRIYYREFDNQDIYQGAVCGCAVIDGINAGEEIEVEASGWTDRCAVIYVEQINE